MTEVEVMELRGMRDLCVNTIGGYTGYFPNDFYGKEAGKYYRALLQLRSRLEQILDIDPISPTKW